MPATALMRAASANDLSQLQPLLRACLAAPSVSVRTTRASKPHLAFEQQKPFQREREREWGYRSYC